MKREESSSKTSVWHGGKGSARRRTSSQEKYSDGWDRIFRTKLEEKSKKLVDTKKKP